MELYCIVLRLERKGNSGQSCGHNLNTLVMHFTDSLDGCKHKRELNQPNWLGVINYICLDKKVLCI